MGPPAYVRLPIAPVYVKVTDGTVVGRTAALKGSVVLLPRTMTLVRTFVDEYKTTCLAGKSRMAALAIGVGARAIRYKLRTGSNLCGH